MLKPIERGEGHVGLEAHHWQGRQKQLLRTIIKDVRLWQAGQKNFRCLMVAEGTMWTSCHTAEIWNGATDSKWLK